MKKMNLLKKNPPSYNAFRGGSYSLIISAVVLALLVVANVFASALPSAMTKYDISSTKLYSVTSNTKVVVNALEQDVTIYWIVQSGKEDDIIENLLSKYETLSGHIKVVKKNPDVFPTFTEQYTNETVQNNSLIVECGDRSRFIGYDDIYIPTTSPLTAKAPLPQPLIMWSARNCRSCICWRGTAKQSFRLHSVNKLKRRTLRSAAFHC